MSTESMDFLGEDMFKEFRGQTMEAYLYYNLTSEPSLRWAKNTLRFLCQILQINVQTVYIDIAMHVCT